MTEVPVEKIRHELERIVASPGFIRSERLSRFLRHIVEKTLAGEAASLKEYTLGVEVYERPADYEPRTDATVRVEATRLRTKLLEFYSTAEDSSVRIDLPKGSYVPQFVTPPADPKPVAASAPAHRLRWAMWGAAAGMMLVGAGWWWSAASPPHAPSVEAQRLYLEGHALWSQLGNYAPLHPVVEKFQAAVQADPRFAPGWADLASAMDRQGDLDRQSRADWLAKARQAARRALELDPRLFGPHKLLGSRSFFDDWDFPAALAELRQAAELEPADFNTQFLYVSALAVSGQLEAAERQIDLAVVANPRSADTAAMRAQIYIWWRRYRKAREEAARAVVLGPQSSFSHWMAGLAAQLDGDIPAAEAAYQAALRCNPREGRATNGIAHILAQQGRMAEARATLEEAVRRSDPRQGWHFNWALLHAAAGEKALALEELDLSIRDREGSAPYTFLDPRFDSLRDEPRWRELAARTGK